MPALKGLALNKRHATKEERAVRESLEATVMPRTRIEVKPPAALKGRKIAAAMWTRLVKLYDETQGTLITAFDENILVEYCKLHDEEMNLETKTQELDKAQQDALKKAKHIKPNAENLKDWVAMWNQINALTNNFKNMDARLDGKRKLKLALEQSLYLTPRSRAGAAPEEKPPTEPKSEMDDLLD